MYNKPQGGEFQATYDGYTALGREASWTAISNETAAGPGASTTSTETGDGSSTIGINVAGSCPTTGTGAATKTTYSVGSQNCGGITYASTLRVIVEPCIVNVAAHCSSGTYATAQLCTAAGNSWVAATYYFDPDAENEEVPCLYNRVHQFLTAAGAAVAVVSSGTTAPAGMEANMKVLYKLLLDLIYGGTSSTYGKDYEDPLCDADGEHPAGSYSAGDGKSDSSFEQETEDMKKAIDDLITAHGTYKTAIGNHTWTGYFSRTTGTNGKTYLQCLTGDNEGDDDVNSVNQELATYKVAIKNRIGEITNRIGVINGKNTGDGGSGGPTPGAMGSGFVGFSFNSGNGYANTVYSHANFLAGKKINLFGKVLKAIVGVQEMYDSVTRKRSEYYEYNQAS